MKIAVLGGGLAGLSCAIRAAQSGFEVDLYEASPRLGGRARSLFDPAHGEWMDAGPHLLIGAYTRLLALCQDAGAANHIHWQPSLRLGLWHPQRGMCHLSPKKRLPFPLELFLSLRKMPGHGWKDALSLRRFVQSPSINDHESVASRAKRLAVSETLYMDFLSPLCIAVMNESPCTANANSFLAVCRAAFDRHDSARLGWFTAPLHEALITPLAQKAEQMGVTIHTSWRAEALTPTNHGVEIRFARKGTRKANYVVSTLPAFDARRLFNQARVGEFRTICNLHLWFEQPLNLPEICIGKLAPPWPWIIDIGRQMHWTEGPHHIAVVYSGLRSRNDRVPLKEALHDLAAIHGGRLPRLLRWRWVCERKATVLVRPHRPLRFASPYIVDAGESPKPGDLPATLESAVRRGEAAVEALKRRQLIQTSPFSSPSAFHPLPILSNFS